MRADGGLCRMMGVGGDYLSLCWCYCKPDNSYW